MDCPKCGYVMSDLDVECARCKRLGEKGAKEPPRAVEAPAPPPPVAPPTPSIPIGPAIGPTPPRAAPQQTQRAAPAAAGGGGVGLILLVWLVWHFLLAPAQMHQSGVTLAQFNNLQTGMTLDEVQSAIGQGTLASKSEMDGFEVSIYEWQGNGDVGANMNATFENGKLTSKAQAGLK